jgi:hypothetical protein
MRFCSYAPAIVFVLRSLVTPADAGTVFTETGAGAGNLPNVGQQTSCGDGSNNYGRLTEIAGTLRADEFADVFQIRVKTGTPFQADTIVSGDPMLSIYSTDSLGVMINDDGGDGVQARLLTTGEAGTSLYYIAIHRYSGAKIVDCQGVNIFTSGLSGTPGTNPVCALTSNAGGAMPYRILFTTGDVTCTADLVPESLLNAAYDASTHEVSWNSYSSSIARKFKITVQPAGVTTELAISSTSMNIYTLLNNGENQIYIKACGDDFDSALSTIGVTVVVPTAVPTSAPTLYPTDTPTAAPTDAPTDTPTDAPTAAPTTLAPTKSPTDAPTRSPTALPTEFVAESVLELPAEEAKVVGEAVSATVATTVAAGVMASATAAIGAAATGAAAGGAAGGGSGSGGACISMVLQVQGMAIMSKLSSVKDDAPSFSGFAESFGIFNLEVQLPWDQEGANSTEVKLLKDEKKVLNNKLKEVSRRLRGVEMEQGGEGEARRLAVEERRLAVDETCSALALLQEKVGAMENTIAGKKFRGHVFWLLFLLTVLTSLHQFLEFANCQCRKFSSNPDAGAKVVLKSSLDLFEFPQPQVLFLSVMYQGSCTVTARALAAAVASGDSALLSVAAIWMAIYPFGFFFGTMYVLFVILPKTSTAKYDAETREWKDCEDADEVADKQGKLREKGWLCCKKKKGVHHFINRFGELFMHYRGVRLAQIFVTLQLSQMLVVGLLTGLLNDPVLATIQAWLVATIAVFLFISMTLYSPIVDPSKWMTLRENVNNSFQLGLGAVSLLLVVIGPYFASDDVTRGACGGSSKGDPLPEINQGVMLMSLVALVINMLILLHDSAQPMIALARDACKANDGEGADGQTEIASSTVTIQGQTKLVI